MGKSLFVFFVFLMAFLIVTLSATLLLGYHGFIDLGTRFLSLEIYTPKIFALVDIQKFRALQVFILSCVFINGLVLVKIDRLKQALYWFYKNLEQSFRSFIDRVCTLEGISVLLIPAIASIYFAFRHPVFYDEAWTFLNYTSRSVFSSMFYYQSTNNHILHSILTNISYHIPFLPYIVRLRLPTVIANLMAQATFFNFMAKYYDRRVAVAAVALSSTLLMSLFYSYFSRGYALELLCFIIVLHAAFNIVCQVNRRIDWVYYTIAAIIGFYTIPLFLFPFAGINVCLLIVNYKGLKCQMLCGVLIMASVLSLYFPPLFINHFVAFADTQRKIAGDIYMGKFFGGTLLGLLGFNPLYTLPFVLAGLLSAVREKKKLVFYAVFLLLPPVLLLANLIVPLPRSFFYYVVIFAMIIVEPFKGLILKSNKYAVVVTCVVIQCLLLYNYISWGENYLVPRELNIDKAVRQIEGPYSYLTDDDRTSVVLQFDLEADGIKGYKLKYFNDVPMSADSLMQYDYVIIGRENDRTIKAQATISNPYFSVYKKGS